MTRRLPPNDVKWLQEHLRDPFKVADRTCDKKNGPKSIKAYIISNVEVRNNVRCSIVYKTNDLVTLPIPC